ncbi:MAG: hypothetical protein EBQ99_02370 [Planctomycetes bacterium]|nr:hypothetical protein [Planctomycetota bacterium]
MITRPLALASLALVFALTGCNDNKMKELENENADLRVKLTSAESERDAAQRERDAANARATEGGKDADARTSRASRACRPRASATRCT